MNGDQIRAVILANPTEPPKSIAERCDVPAWKVKDARKGLIAIGAVPRLTAVRGLLSDVDTAAIIEMRRAGHSIGVIKDHFRRSYSVVFRIIAAATRAGKIDPAQRIVPAKPAKPAKARAATNDAETQPVKRRQREERETCRGGLGDMPAPRVRLSLNMTEAEERAVASLSRLQRGTRQELLASVRNVESRKRLHKRDLEPWEGAGPFHS